MDSRPAIPDPVFRSAGCAAILAAAMIAPLHAEPPDRIRITGGSTLVASGASDGRVSDEITFSTDLHIRSEGMRGHLFAWIEASAVPRDDGGAALLPESNADAATAVYGDGDLRLQVSELKYTRRLDGDRHLGGGLIDPTAYLDTTRINNDENMQFLGTSFLNNPTIHFPDYTIGVAYHQESHGRRPDLFGVVSGSHGLADTPGMRYGDLLSVAEDGRGIFVGAEAGWSADHHQYRVGAWTNTRDDRVEGAPGGGGPTRGIYLTAGYTRGRHALSLRLGAASEEVPTGSRFGSLTWQTSWAHCVAGIGAARTRPPAEGAGEDLEAMTQAEGYLRVALGDGVFLTPSVQSIAHSGFDGAGTAGPSRAMVYALRLRILY